MLNSSDKYYNIWFVVMTCSISSRQKPNYMIPEELNQYIKKRNIPEVKPYAVSGLLYKKTEGISKIRKIEDISKNDREKHRAQDCYTTSSVTTFGLPKLKASKDTTLSNVQAFNFLLLQDKSEAAELPFKHLNTKPKLTYKFKEKSDDSDTLYEYPAVPCGMLAVDSLCSTVDDGDNGVYFGSFNSNNKVVYCTQEELDNDWDHTPSFEKSNSLHDDYKW